MYFFLKAAISTERLKALEWMEKHNREKETLRELQVRPFIEFFRDFFFGISIISLIFLIG